MLLAGGAAKIPRVQSSVRSLFGDARFGMPDIPPDEAAALGAGSQAALLVFHEDGSAVVDRKGKKLRYPRAQASAITALPRTALPLSVRLGDRQVQLVPAGELLPLCRKVSVTLFEGETLPTQLPVVEGDSDVLATVELSKLPVDARQLLVVAEIDIRGGLLFRVKEPASGLEHEIRVDGQ